jgi:dTDP-glucose pyrophosphorylase/CBS domain-containing protein
MRSSPPLAAHAFCVATSSSIRDAMAMIDRNGLGVAVAVDQDDRFVGVITDGDVRRAMLASLDLSQPVATLLAAKAGTPNANAVSAPAGTSPAEALEIMRAKHVRHLQLIDNDGRVVALETYQELVEEGQLPLRAVIMAGGFGSRLSPLTQSTPKPMLPVGDKPLLERTVKKLRGAGIQNIVMTTHYLPDRIHDHFGDGSAFGVSIRYIHETEPLGTAGALGMIDESSEPLLVMNGDIMTDVNYAAMLSFHSDAQADLTVGVATYQFVVPYGVIDCDGERVVSVSEKPRFDFLINAGIYLLSPRALTHVPKGRRFDMTDLIRDLIRDGRNVVSFPIREYWLDIGRHEDYAQAESDLRSGVVGPWR